MIVVYVLFYYRFNYTFQLLTLFIKLGIMSISSFIAVTFCPHTNKLDGWVSLFFILELADDFLVQGLNVFSWYRTFVKTRVRVRIVAEVVLLVVHYHVCVYIMCLNAINEAVCVGE